MSGFDAADYGSNLTPLLVGAPAPPLGPGKCNSTVAASLKALDADSLAERPIANREMADCCLAGLWLLHGFLDESHTLSQRISTPTGSYWHGLMHRREPDFSNAKYWFRRVGDHPIFSDLLFAAQQVVADDEDAGANWLLELSAWDAFRFIDQCQTAIGQRNSLEQLCVRIAEIEWQLLFDYCFQNMQGAE